MISIQQIQLPITHITADLEKKMADILGVHVNRTKDYTITKRAIDSRKNER